MRRCQVAVVEFLLQRYSPSINTRDSHSYTLLLLLTHARVATSKTQGADTWKTIMKQLLQEGANMEAWMEITKGMPLLAAAYHDHFKDMKVLLEYRADANTHDATGMTVLSLVAGKGNLKMVQLLKHKAKVNPLNLLQMTPLDHAIRPENLLISGSNNTGIPERLQIVELLLKSKPDQLVNKPEIEITIKGITSIGLAIYIGNPDMVSLLLNYPGSNIKQGVFSFPLLCDTAYRGKEAVVTLLIEQGISHDRVDGCYGHNTLIWAAIQDKRLSFQ